MSVPILKLHDVLIASVQGDLEDSDWKELQNDLLQMLGTHRSRGVVVDVTRMDVLDSFAARTLQSTVEMLRLRGGRAVVTGIQPGVAFAMAQLGLDLGYTDTALDLEGGLDILGRAMPTARLR